MWSAVRVRVPATSANLGPGLDTLGLALGLHNDITVRATAAGAAVSIEGEGAERFATGEGNLVVRSARAAMAELGFPAAGLALHCVNRIPSARGLGSSAASIVAGVVAGAALAGAARSGGDDGTSAWPGVAELEDVAWVLDLCARLEGHPDNVAACLLGGATVAWYEPDGRARAVRAEPAADLLAIALVPAGRVATADARRLLPERVSLDDAAHSAGRAALMTLALTGRTDLLLAATEDRLHQTYREPAMPRSVALLRRLRANGLAATISGAGPSVLVLGAAAATAREEDADLLEAVRAVDTSGFDVVPLTADTHGAQVHRLG
jgi:homoserine kinase